MSFTPLQLVPQKVVALTVCTEESLEHEQAESWIKADMVRSVVDAVDLAFSDPSNNGSGDQPAAVTNGVTPVVATGDVAVDVAALMADFGGDLLEARFVGHPSTFALLAALFDTAGVRGSIAGIPIVASRAAPATHLSLIDPSGIALAGGVAAVRVSREGTIEMDSEPDMESTDLGSPGTPTGAQVVSMFQTNSCALRTEIAVSWLRVRPASVSVLDVGAWTATGSPE